MRTNSPKQSEASRANGSRSKGPKSARGKNQVRLNALHDGLFSKDIVIESAGERKEDFERVKKEIWDFFQPTSALEKMLVADFVENWWRRQRVRRAESAELRNRLDTLYIRDELRRSDEVEPLRARFLGLLSKYVLTLSSQPLQDTSEITAELEEIRQQLAATSLGVEFLIKKMEGVQSEAREKDQNSLSGVAMISACCGFGSELGQICLLLNLAIKKEFGSTTGADQSPVNKGDSGPEDEIIRLERRLKSMIEANKRESAAEVQTSQPSESDQATSEQRRTQAKKDRNKKTGEGTELKAEYSIVLSAAIGMAISQLKVRKQTLEYAEKWEAKTRSTASILPADSSDRFSRAETAIERRLYRALGMLLALKSAPDLPKMLP
jgi:hypothetical protein